MTAGPSTPRTPPGPIDPVIRSWVDEAGLSLDCAWIYLGTPERTLSHDDDWVWLDMIHHQPAIAGAYHSQLFLPSNAFEPEWDGYRLELLGGLRILKEPGFEITPDLPFSTGPTFSVRDASGEVSLEVELWRQRCYRPSGPADTDVPPLVAETHWWPRSPKQQPFFRITTGHPDHLRPTDIRQARKDWALLDQIPLTVSKTGRRFGTGEMPDETTFRSKVDPVVRALVCSRGKATRDDAAAELHMSSDHLKTLTHDRTGLDWPEYVKTVINQGK